MASKLRRQRVALRFKRREQLKHHLRGVIVRSVVVALIIGFGAGLVTGHDSFLSRFIKRHTPTVTVSAPKTLAGLPMLTEIPKNAFWLWFPGSGVWLQRRLQRKYLAVKGVRLEREFNSNRLTVHLAPRVPLVTWNGSGFDREGILFAMTPGTWKVLPQANFLASANRLNLGRWLERFSATSEVWSQVVAIKQDPYGVMELTLKSGAVVIWGMPEPEPFTRKTQTLARVLDDAHKNLGGTAHADLRFFDQGRIIVKPKGR